MLKLNFFNFRLFDAKRSKHLHKMNKILPISPNVDKQVGTFLWLSSLAQVWRQCLSLKHLDLGPQVKFKIYAIMSMLTSEQTDCKHSFYFC